MTRQRALAALLLFGSGHPLAAWADSATNGAGVVAIDPSGLPAIGQVDPRFQSYNVEMAEVIGGRFWAPYPKPGEQAQPVNTQASGGLALEASLFRQRPPVDLADRRLLALARGLGPAYIRVSGSWANTTWFHDSDGPAPDKPPKGFQNILTRQQWAGVVAFAKAVNGRLTISFAASDGARDANGVWKPDEARKLLRYTRRIGGRIYGAELVNEPNLGATSGLPAGYNAAAFARDIAAFRDFVKAEAPDLRTIGPGSTGETGVALFNSRGLSTESMLGADPHPRFDYFAYHFYGGRSERCSRMAPTSAILPENALGEEWLSRTDRALAFYKDLRDRFNPGAPIWLNETAQASCGGDRWAASFLDSFRYTDQMGRLARGGVSAVFHNTLAASDYGLIDEATLTPRPNYWAALLWRRLMGETVLGGTESQPGLHLYSHCLRGKSGGVALLAMNLDPGKARQIALTKGGEGYALTARELRDQAVFLNGATLSMKGDRLPRIAGVRLSPGILSLPPASIQFVAVPDAGNPACTSARKNR